MYCGSRKSSQRLYHRTECPSAKRIKSYNVKWFVTKEDAVDCGFQACQWCSVLGQRYRKELEEIKQLTKKYGIKVWYEDDAVYVKTSISSWKIIREGRRHKLHLYHENAQIYRFCRVIDSKYVKTYHEQKGVFRNNLVEYIEYIVEHDTWRESLENGYKTMARGSKKARLKYKKEKEKMRKRSIRRVLNTIEEMELNEKCIGGI